MRTKEDVEQYLIDLDTDYEVVDEGLYRLIDDVQDVEDIFVHVTGPLVIFSFDRIARHGDQRALSDAQEDDRSIAIAGKCARKIYDGNLRVSDD